MIDGNYVYMVRCSDGSLYTGWSTNPVKRAAVHNSGKGAKYTKSRRPVELVYYEKLETKQEAMSREAFIKKMKRSEKMQLVEDFTRSGKWMKVSMHSC